MRLTRFCKCGYHAIVDGPTTVTCPLCGLVFCVDVPKWVVVLQRVSKPQDIGIGATVKRIASMIGGERFKHWATRLGIPCGCADREQEWNRLYPNPDYRLPNA